MLQQISSTIVEASTNIATKRSGEREVRNDRCGKFVPRHCRTGNQRLFQASVMLSRKDFGIDINMPLETGGVVLGDKVMVTLDIEALKTA